MAENVSGDSMSIEVGWEMVMRIEHRLTRELWVRLMGSTDKNQLAQVGVSELVKSGVDRSALWRALKELEGLNLIKRRNGKWDEVWISPRAVHAYSLRDEKLAQAIADFDAGTMEIKRELLNRKGGKDE